MKSVIKNNAFTIIELLVAMSLLVILLGLSGVVFHTTVAAHRAAGATIDVTRNLRALTDQLNTDFHGLRKDAPLFIAFEQQWTDTNGDGLQDIDDKYDYYDRIHFFADGDFQTMQQYSVRYDGNNDKVLDSTDTSRFETISGNVARIYYGNANTPSGLNYASSGLLSRKSHILAANLGLLFDYGEIPLISNWPPSPMQLPPATPLVYNYYLFNTDFGVSNAWSINYADENELEFDTISFTNWVNTLNYYLGVDGLAGTADDGPDNANWFINYCMTDAYRPVVDLEDIDTLHLLLAQGILQMRIQWAYTADDLTTPGLFAGVRWWPSVDPNRDGNTADSDFTTMNRSQLGVYFQLPGGANVDVDGDSVNDWFAIQNCWTGGTTFNGTFYPKALKFTFVLKDSNGIFVDGKTFTHIVYID